MWPPSPMAIGASNPVRVRLATSVSRRTPPDRLLHTNLGASVVEAANTPTTTPWLLMAMGFTNRGLSLIVSTVISDVPSEGLQWKANVASRVSLVTTRLRHARDG